MLTGFREYLGTKGGQYVAIVGLVLALVALSYTIYSNLGGSDAASLSSERVFLCVETNKSYEMELKAGMRIPAPSPFSGKDTGYLAELCYWTADGNPKKEPTAVVLNEELGKPGNTYCPDCGRLVVHYNPPATEGAKPPPKKIGK